MAFVREHFGERVESPIVKHSPIAVFVPLCMLFHHHLSLTQITNHHSSLNQFVSNEMRRFVQRIRCFLRFFCETRLYTFERWIYRLDFFLHLSRFERMVSSCLLCHCLPLNPPIW